MDAYHIVTPAYARVESMENEVALSKMDVPRHWQDVWSVRLGGQYELLPELLRVRAGTFYETGATPLQTTFLDFFAYDRIGVGAGLALTLGVVQLDLAYLHVFQEPRAVSEEEGEVYQLKPAYTCQEPYTGSKCDPHYQGQPGAVSNAGTYLSAFDVFSLSASLNFR
jgi:long-subunit fatty acid transport protein